MALEPWQVAVRNGTYNAEAFGNKPGTSNYASSSSTSSYDPNIDYASAIQKAIQSGASDDIIQSLVQARESKIANNPDKWGKYATGDNSTSSLLNKYGYQPNQNTLLMNEFQTQLQQMQQAFQQQLMEFKQQQQQFQQKNNYNQSNQQKQMNGVLEYGMSNGVNPQTNQQQPNNNQVASWKQGAHIKVDPQQQGMQGAISRYRATDIWKDKLISQ